MCANRVTLSASVVPRNRSVPPRGSAGEYRCHLRAVRRSHAVSVEGPGLAAVLVDVLCRALKEAYAQVNSIALDDTVHRPIKVLGGSATKIGQRSGSLVQIPVYLTQEEIAQMAGARRERISRRSIRFAAWELCSIRPGATWCSRWTPSSRARREQAIPAGAPR